MNQSKVLSLSKLDTTHACSFNLGQSEHYSSSATKCLLTSPTGGLTLCLDDLLYVKYLAYTQETFFVIIRTIQQYKLVTDRCMLYIHKIQTNKSKLYKGEIIQVSLVHDLVELVLHLLCTYSGYMFSNGWQIGNHTSSY